MSKRFQRFVEDWIPQNVRPSSMDSYERSAEDLVRACLEEGARQGFAPNEVAEEKAFIGERIKRVLEAENIPDLGNMRGGDD
ncbi:MAG: hypothetical protein U1E56_03275 [Bauldia sp.]|mgnify:CR=1 FL=1